MKSISIEKEVESIPHSSPIQSPVKQDSIFAKILQRLSILEKSSTEIDSNLTDIKDLFTREKAEAKSHLSKLDTNLKEKIALLVIHF